jgi:hypothetical protein
MRYRMTSLKEEVLQLARLAKLAEHATQLSSSIDLSTLKYENGTDSLQKKDSRRQCHLYTRNFELI